jgi:dienelactone hydrolase
MKSTLLTLNLPDKENISIDFYKPQKKQNVPILLILHGFKGFKNWGFFPYISEYFCKEGYATFTINFSLNGVLDSIGNFFDVERFANNTLSREFQEVNIVLDWLIEKGIASLQIPWNNQIYLLGHSRGGGIAALVNASHPLITASAHWASVGKFGRTTSRQNQIWKETGKLEIPNTRTGQMLHQNYSYFEDLQQNSEKLSVRNAVENTTKPMLFVHGSEDLVIKPQEVSSLPELNAKKIVHYKEINKTGHTFSVQHPMETAPEALLKALSLTSTFFTSPFLFAE